MPKAHSVPIARLKERKKAVTSSCSLYLDPDVAQEISAAQVALEEAEDALAKRRGDLDLAVARDTARKELNRLHDKAVDDENVVSFTFRALGKKRYQQLIDLYPPNEEQQKKLKELGGSLGVPAEKIPRLTYDSDRFPPILTAHASVDPVITEEEANEMWASDQWNQEELATLFTAAFNAQTHRHLPLDT